MSLRVLAPPAADPLDRADLRTRLQAALTEFLAGQAAHFDRMSEDLGPLRDDVLGVFGDPAVTGKPAGDDLREGKRTALVAAALAAASSAQAELVNRHLGDPDLDDSAVAALRAAITDTGALDRVEALIADRVSAALAALHGAAVDDEARAALAELVVAATDRRG